MPDNELFSLIQKQRTNVMRWLDSDYAERSEVLETVIRIVTLRGQKAKAEPNRVWRHADGFNCIGRYVPDMTERSKIELEGAEEVRHITRPEGSIMMEVNVQIGTFTVEMNRVEALDQKITEMTEFLEVGG